MDTATIFGDIHANLPALEAALADMDTRGLSNRYCLGDLVGYGTSPNEVVETIRESKIPTLIGNYDQGVGNSSDDCGCAYTSKEAEALGKRSIAWSNLHTSEENKRFLRRLPRHLPLQLGVSPFCWSTAALAELMNTSTKTGRMPAWSACWTWPRRTCWSVATPTSPTTASCPAAGTWSTPAA